MFGVQFYPTPKPLVDKMLSLVDFSKVNYALEPSAGKGDIAEAIRARKKRVECVEIDKDLQSVLEGRCFDVVGNDFLSFETHTRYDLIAMNPPFASGDKHLIRAIDAMKNGGQIVCILNAETLNNPDSASRQHLLNKLSEHNAKVEVIENAFAEAERKARVNVALIYVDIPAKEEEDVLHNLRESIMSDNSDAEYCENQLAETNIFRSMVRQYEFECKAGLTLIDTYNQLIKYVPESKEGAKTRIISIGVNISEELENLSFANRYVRELRKKYWSMLFMASEMQQLFTKEIKESYLRQLERFRSYDFTISNILQLQIDLSEKLLSGVDEAIIKMFDQLTYENSMEKDGNVHYYDGWKTNKACRVGQKVIFPVYGLYDGRWGGSWWAYKAYDALRELEKILNYLDSGRTDGVNCWELIEDAFKVSSKTYSGEWIPCKFFYVSLKKKGTVHVKFTDLELLKKFNIFGANKRNWLPPNYGKKRYEDMSKEEKTVVDSFEGKKEYEKTMQKPAFYLGGASLLMLGAGKEATR